MGCACSADDQGDFLGAPGTNYPILVKEFEEYCISSNGDSIIIEKYTGSRNQQWKYEDGKFSNTAGFIGNGSGGALCRTTKGKGVKCRVDGWTISLGGSKVFTIINQTFFQGAMGEASPILFKSNSFRAPNASTHYCLTLQPDYSVAITEFVQNQTQYWFFDGVYIRYAAIPNAIVTARKCAAGSQIQVAVAKDISKVGANAEWEFSDGQFQLQCNPMLKMVPSQQRQAINLVQAPLGKNYRKSCDFFPTIGPTVNPQRVQELSINSVSGTPSNCDSETYQARGKRGKGKKMITKTRNFEVKNLMSQKRVKYRAGFNGTNHYFSFTFPASVRITTVIIQHSDDSYDSHPSNVSLYSGSTPRGPHVCTWNVPRPGEQWVNQPLGVSTKERVSSQYWTLKINRVHSGSKIGIGRIRFRGVNLSAVKQPIEKYGVLGVASRFDDPYNTNLVQKKMYQKFLTGEDALEMANSSPDMKKQGWS